MTRRLVSLAILVALVAAVGACSDSGSGDKGIRVVGSFYPLAWLARSIGGNAVVVEDLTPAGGEPHEIQLTARQRAAIQDATLVLYLGGGFQPDLEDAVRDIGDRAVDLLDGLSLLPSTEEGLAADPHVWLDPVLMKEIAAKVADALAEADPAGETGYKQREADTVRELNAVDIAYRTVTGVCELKTLVTTHESFGYLARRYGLTQLGLTGLTPEAEPSASQIKRVRDLAREGKVAAIFVEPTDEGRRIGGSVARDVGVPARDLSTLEMDPTPSDYVGVMTTNLQSLQAGLRCS